MAPPEVFKRVAVIGLGLIGGSVGAAARASEFAQHVVGFAPDGHAQRALALGLIDEVASSAAQAASNADLVIIATPVTQMALVFAEIASHLKPQALITDCGSTKGNIVAAARQHLGPAFARFVPGHPISGSEFSGPDAARADLFNGKLWLLAPVDQAQQGVAVRLQVLLESMGAKCQQIDAAIHDELFAEYSHAPHALVFAICQAVAAGPNAARLSEFAGAGFKDTTRIGASSPQLWTDILLDNRRPVVAAMDRYLEAMVQMRGMLDRNDRQGLLDIITHASKWRASL